MRLVTLQKMLTEMAKPADICANCGFPKWSFVNGKRYHYKCSTHSICCTPEALKQGKANGYPANGNKFISTSQPASSVTPAPSTSNTASNPSPTPKQPQPTSTPKTTHQAAQQTLPPDRKAALEQWLGSFDVSPTDYEIVDNLLNIKKDVTIDLKGASTIPVPFGKIEGDFALKAYKLTSFKNAPKEVTGDFICTGTAITDFDGLDIRVGGNVDLSGTRILDYTDINKHFREIGWALWIDLGVVPSEEQGGINILKIKGLRHVGFFNQRLTDLFNKYLSTDEKTIFDIQEELIDGGFSQYARTRKKQQKTPVA